MIPNAVNAIIGIWLVYVAILDPAWGDRTSRVALTAIVIGGCAMWARTTDFGRWQSNTTIALALALLVVTGLQAVGVIWPLLRFWSLFWVGILVPIVSLWAVLYRPAATA